MPGKLIFTILSAYCRLHALIERVVMAGERLVAGIAMEATTVEEKMRYTVARYDAIDHSRDLDLFDWERSWFAKRLPPPPAPILLGACGAGRELLWMLDAGYNVDAFEPASSMVSLADQRLHGRVRIGVFRFEDLIDAVLRGAPGAAEFVASSSYDAVILGWGSFSHVIDREMQANLFRALDRICPRGPILASYWRRSEQGPVNAGRAERIGRSIGRGLSRLRGSQTQISEHVVFTSHAGFAYAFTADELNELADRVGRTAVWEGNGDIYPHVTFLRRG